MRDEVSVYGRSDGRPVCKMVQHARRPLTKSLLTKLIIWGLLSSMVMCGITVLENTYIERDISCMPTCSEKPVAKFIDHLEVFLCRLDRPHCTSLELFSMILKKQMLDRNLYLAP